ncbi:MAG TPA: hypothetical protein VFE47_16065 [Tepidisphaeraceae bacterium]|jgi:hypothetical protein|nr:hypothetical protein [Tepidisphaeraceae bacterium]
MLRILLKAEGPDPTDSNLTFVLICMIAIGAVCLLAAIPVVTARRRGLPQVEGIAALMVLWGLVTAGSIIYATNAQMQFNKEYTMRIMQNYDANDRSDQPSKPWFLWGCLVAVYGGAMLWASSAKNVPARGFPIEPRPPKSEG